MVVKPAWDEAGGSIELSWQSNLPAARGEPSELLQVLLNLSANSLRAVAECPAKVLRITILSAKASDRSGIEIPLLRIRVCDTGPGLTHPEALFHAFQPGAQATGLGLYVARALMRNAGGDLHYESSPESGACFIIEMLAAPARIP